MRKPLTSVFAALLALVLSGCFGDGMSPNAVTVDLATQDSVTVIPWKDEAAPQVTVGLPDWLETVKYEPDPDDGSLALERIGGLWARGSIDIAYTSDDAVKYMEYQLDPDYIVGNHLFGSRYTQVEASDIKRTEIGGHEVLWGWYRFNDEYDRPNMYYVSVAQVTEGEALEILVVEPSVRDGNITLDESYLFSLWELVSW